MKPAKLKPFSVELATIYNYNQHQMKFNHLLLIGILTFALQISYAQKPENGKVIITGSRFTYPLLEKWIEEFKKEYPEVPFRILVRGNSNADSANLIINAHKLHPEEIRGGNYVVNIGKYALLPVANAKNPLVPEWNKKGLKVKQLKKMFFLKVDPYQEAEEPIIKQKKGYEPTVYTRAQKACAPITYARHYGFEQEHILGKVIGGDDKHLITAIENDTNGITYNNLGFIYDLRTRKVKPSISVVPLDLNGNGKLDQEENIYGTLDELIQQLETQKLPLIVTEQVNITYPGQINESNRNLTLFIGWILNNGQKFNHEFGFLDFDPATLAKQKEILAASVAK